MFMHKSKKGFTIVELVIVIAVIAILAAVLIPTFSNLVKKANLSNDKSFVKNMNTTLAAEGAVSKFKTAGDAIDALNRNGFAGKYNTYSSNFHYCYSIENNKMYLLDDNNEVVFPEEKVEKSTLWGLYTDNRTSVTAGVTKYVAIANITNSDHYNDVFATGTYTIDLNDYMIAVDSTLTNVTASNGIIIGGAASGTGVNTGYEVVEAKGYTGANSASYYSSIGKDADGVITISNKIITETVYIYLAKNIVFDNCVFYNGALNIDDSSGYTGNKVTVKNCKFVGMVKESWAILAHGSVEVIDCTFTNLQTRGAVQVQENSVDIEVKISGCTFDGTAGSYPVIRFVGRHEASKTENDIASLEISNCSFTAMNKATGIIGFSGDGSCLYNYTGAAGQTTVKFSGNKFGDIGGKFLVGGGAGNTLGTLLSQSAK